MDGCRLPSGLLVDEECFLVADEARSRFVFGSEEDRILGDDDGERARGERALGEGVVPR